MKNISLRNRPDQFQATLPLGPCIHHWRIAEQNGSAMLPGTCQNCGITKPHRASSDAYNESDFANRYAR
jgi:hypothetical protein